MPAREVRWFPAKGAGEQAAEDKGRVPCSPMTCLGKANGIGAQGWCGGCARNQDPLPGQPKGWPYDTNGTSLRSCRGRANGDRSRAASCRPGARGPSGALRGRGPGRSGRLRGGRGGLLRRDRYPRSRARRSAACAMASNALSRRERSAAVIGAGPPPAMPISRRCRATSRPASALPILSVVQARP